MVAKLSNTDEPKQLKVISRAGKATSKKYNSWLNVIDEETQETQALDWKEVKEWEELPAEEILISDSYNPAELLAAKFDEIKKWNDYDVYEEVENTGQKAISTRWVNTVKDEVIKARLVARGYEDTELKERVDSPTCEKSNLRLAVAIAASNQWRVNSLDIQSAFLQGESVEGEIFLKPPKEVNTTCVWKLKRHVYGLKQASRKWYERILKELLQLGVLKSKLDEAFFYWHNKGSLSGVIAGHVDDFFWAGTEHFKQQIIDPIRNMFNISSDLQDSFKFLGLFVNQTPGGITVNQHAYAKNIKTINDIKGNKSRLLNEAEKEQLRSVIGQLSWLGNQTRPDISSNVCQLSGAYKEATVSDIVFTNKTIRKTVSDDVSLKFPKLDLKSLKLEVHSDASYNNLPNGGSQGGFIILLCDSSGKAAPIQWQSRRIKRVVKSTLAAECLALEEAADYAYYVKSMVTEVLALPTDIELNCYIDNKSLDDVITSSNNVKEDKRLIQDISLIKEMMFKEEINSVSLVESKKNLADVLTKRGASSQLLEEVLNTGSIACVDR